MDAQLALDVGRIARQAALDRQKCFAPQNDGMPQQQSVFSAEISELRLIEARGEWSGRGKLPAWLADAERQDRKREDFAVYSQVDK